MKRLLDAVLAGCGLVVLAPLFLIVAIAIRVTMGSPVLFRQLRPGYHGKPFELLKFRSMDEKFGPDGLPLPAKDRLTRLGYVLRRSSIDEMPELWNILKGEMSVVGPRPLLMDYLPRYSAEQARRHEVKPGLTGLAQINGRHLLAFEDRFKLDVWYVDHWSLRLDMHIIRSTVRQVLTGQGLPESQASDFEFLGVEGEATNTTESSPLATALSTEVSADAAADPWMPADVHAVRSDGGLVTRYLATDDPAWMSTLDRLPHDVYHLPAYLQFAARRETPGEPLAFVAQEGESVLFVPLIVRPVPAGLTGDGPPLYDATGPHGYPGALVRADHDDSFAGRAVAAFVDSLRERDVVSAFIRMHPLLPPPLDVLTAAGSLVGHADSVSIDLDLSPEELRQQTRQNHRRDIKRATRDGYTVRIDDRWEAFDAFVDVYQQSMERLDAAEFWRLSSDYFRDLHETLPDDIKLCVAEIGGEVAAAALLTEVDGIVEYYLAGTASRHFAASPSKLIVDFAARWAKERGNHTLHLAGSVSQGDPLNHFKTGFSPRLHPVWTWRVITDPARYERLAARQASSAGLEADPPEGFFPAYRRTA